MEATSKINITIGSIVEGNDFYGREKELQKAVPLILRGQSLLLSDPRRVGKSSFSMKLLEMAKEEGWKTFYFDIARIKTEEELVKELEKDLKEVKWWNKIRDIFLDLLDGFNGSNFFALKLSINTNAFRRKYKKIKNIFESVDNTLIVIDELGVFLKNLLEQKNGIEKTESFLLWFKEFRRVSKGKIRWIFCSSVGIEHLASKHNLEKYLADLTPMQIGAFSQDEAKDFISKLDIGENAQFTKENTQYILEKLGWYLPYFIQLFVESIKSMVSDDAQITNGIIDNAYNNLLTENKMQLNFWVSRIKEYGSCKEIAHNILIFCSESKEGRSRDNLLANLLGKKTNLEEIEKNLMKSLDMLKTDGYLLINDDKYTFHSHLLRDFWFNKFIK